MHYGLELRLQRHFECHEAYEMFQELKLGFQATTRFFACAMKENSSIGEHVLGSSGCYNRLNQVGVDLPDKIVIDILLQVTATKLLKLRDEL